LYFVHLHLQYFLCNFKVCGPVAVIFNSRPIFYFLAFSFYLNTRLNIAEYSDQITETDPDPWDLCE